MAGGDDGPAHEEFLWSLGVGSALPDWLKELRKEERARGLNQGPRRTRAPPASRPGFSAARPHGAASGEGVAAASATAAGAAAAPAASSTGAPAAPAQSVYEPAPRATASSSTSSGTAQQSVYATPPAAQSPPQLEQQQEEQQPHEQQQPWSAEELDQRRVDPDDGKVWTLAEFLVSFRHQYSEADIATHWREKFRPVPAEEAVPAAAAAIAEAASAAAPPPPEVASSSAAADAAPAATSSQSHQGAAPPSRSAMSIKDWLQSMDDSGFLSQYHDSIVAVCSSVDQLYERYIKPGGGELDTQFFADAGIKKLGHKRLFEKWFRENPMP